MFSFKIVAVVLLATTLQTQCSFVHEAVPVPAAPALRYTLVAPQNIRPFAAQVSTFTKGLNVYAAPYAAGVVGGPAIVSRNIVPAPYQPLSAVAPAPYAPGPFPYYAGSAPPLAASPYYPEQVPALGAYPRLPGPVPALAASPYVPAGAAAAPAFGASPYVPAGAAAAPGFAASPYVPAGAAVAPAGVAPAHLLPAPFGRSVHAVAPAVV